MIDNYSFRIVAVPSALEFADEYEVFTFDNESMGTIMRYDCETDDIFTYDRFFATPGVPEDGGDDFATFGEALNYLISEFNGKTRI